MNGINEVYLLGRVGQPPEFKQLPSGNSVCTFNVATNSNHKQGDSEKNETEWSSVKLWARQAEIADQYVNKGDLVAILGRLKTERWEDALGQPKSRTYVYARRLTLMPRETNRSSPSPTNGEAIPF